MLHVFQANDTDKEVLADSLIAGKWYHAEAGWVSFAGPYNSEAEAQAAFLVYAQERRCPSCGD